MSECTSRIVTATYILQHHGFPINVIDIIIAKSFKDLNKFCFDCGKIDTCIVCKKCRNCDSNYSNSEMCSKCIDDGWYMCGKHGTLENDKYNKHCFACYR